jgi:pilus assembly protein CpaE
VGESWEDEAKTLATSSVILLVDEDAPYRNQLKTILEAERVATVLQTGHGVQAVSLAEEGKPAVVLVAVEEPLRRAVQTIESIHAVLPEAPIIAYSKLTDVAVLRQAMRAGVRDFLVKPLKTPQLLSAIADAMGNASAGPARGDGAATTAAPSAGTVVAVVGAKGGIGKTMIATNLAAAIARQEQHSVVIVDLDTRFGDVAIMLDVQPVYTVADVAANVQNLDRESFRAALIRHESGAFVLPSVKSPTQWRETDPSQLKEVIRFAAKVFDYVVVDTPGTFTRTVAGSIEVASQVLLVTTVDIASVKDTTFVLDVLEREGFPQDRVQITVNHANGSNRISAEEVGRVLQKEIRWVIPHDSAVTVASQVGSPVVVSRPDSRAARRFTEMAEHLTGVKRPPGPRGFTRLLNRSRRRQPRLPQPEESS